MMSSLSMQKCASLNQFILNLDLPFSRKGVFGFASYKKPWGNTKRTNKK